MKNLLLTKFLLFAFAFTLFSCATDEKDEPWTEPVVTTTGLYVLNSGNMGHNDASLAYYNMEDKRVSKNVFYNVNDQKLGDIAQDMAIYGSKMYIAVTNSNIIFITDRNAKLIKTISPKNDNDEPLQPRSIVTHEGKVYVSTEDGYILQIDTTTTEISQKIKIGSFSEEMTIVNNKLYITNSRANNVVSVLDTKNMKNPKTDIIVAENPALITSDQSGNIFVLSWGVWDKNVPSSLQKIDPITNQVTVIGTDIATEMALNGDKLLLMQLDYSTIPVSTNFLYYDIKNGNLVNQSFIKDGTNITSGNSITVDPTNGNIYIGTGDYISTGKMYVFSSDGKLLYQFETGGYYPMGVYFLTESK